MTEKTNSPKLSIVIPVYNGELFVSDCLESAYSACERFTAETGGGAEIICVDDGSSDNSVEVIESQFPNVVLLRNERNVGFAPTCNRGLEVARGEYLYLLNQDTRSRVDSLLTLYRKLCSDPQLGIVGPKFVGFDGHLQRECRSLPTYENVFYELTGLARLFSQSRKAASLRLRWFDHQSEAFVEQPMGAAMLFRRSLLEEIGSLDESFPIFFNDVDWARRILDAGYVNLYCPSAIVEHFIGSATRPKKPQMIRESHRCLYRYFGKWKRQNNLWDKLLLLVWRVALSVTGAIRSWYWTLRG
jgi:GT2 family glycosyltransferase